MSALSRLALALAVSVAACGERSLVGPGSQSSVNVPPTLLPSPEVSVYFPPSVQLIVVSWTYTPSSNALDASGFLVEHATHEVGPWSSLGLTTKYSMVDGLDAGERSCYRVTAVTSNPDSPASRPLCVVMR